MTWSHFSCWLSCIVSVISRPLTAKGWFYFLGKKVSRKVISHKNISHKGRKGYKGHNEEVDKLKPRSALCGRSIFCSPCSRGNSFPIPFHQKVWTPFFPSGVWCTRHAIFFHLPLFEVWFHTTDTENTKRQRKAVRWTHEAERSFNFSTSSLCPLYPLRSLCEIPLREWFHTTDKKKNAERIKRNAASTYQLLRCALGILCALCVKFLCVKGFTQRTKRRTLNA